MGEIQLVNIAVIHWYNICKYCLCISSHHLPTTQKSDIVIEQSSLSLYPGNTQKTCCTIFTDTNKNPWYLCMWLHNCSLTKYSSQYRTEQNVYLWWLCMPSGCSQWLFPPSWCVISQFFHSTSEMPLLCTMDDFIVRSDIVITQRNIMWSDIVMAYCHGEVILSWLIRNRVIVNRRCPRHFILNRKV